MIKNVKIFFPTRNFVTLSLLTEKKFIHPTKVNIIQFFLSPTHTHIYINIYSMPERKR